MIVFVRKSDGTRIPAGGFEIGGGISAKHVGNNVIRLDGLCPATEAPELTRIITDTRWSTRQVTRLVTHTVTRVTDVTRYPWQTVTRLSTVTRQRWTNVTHIHTPYEMSCTKYSTVPVTAQTKDVTRKTTIPDGTVTKEVQYQTKDITVTAERPVTREVTANSRDVTRETTIATLPLTQYNTPFSKCVTREITNIVTGAGECPTDDCPGCAETYYTDIDFSTCDMGPWTATADFPRTTGCAWDGATGSHAYIYDGSSNALTPGEMGCISGYWYTNFGGDPGTGYYTRKASGNGTCPAGTFSLDSGTCNQGSDTWPSELIVYS